MTDRQTDRTVTILLATRNGAAWLPAQLDSLLAQTHGDWRLWVSDDGSGDGTPALLAAFAAAHPGRVRLFRGPGRGSAANFLTLLCHPDLPPGPVAFCDQDDVWLRGKLARALRRMPPGPVPALYAAGTCITDRALRPRRRLRRPAHRAGFANALVQNLCPGHTILLNPAAVALARRAGAPPRVAFADWWLYQLVTGAGGRCHIDPLPMARYRQHGGNEVGAGGPSGVLWRAIRVLRRDYRRWQEAHHRALRGVAPLLTPAARAALTALDGSAPAGPGRLWSYLSLGLRRASRAGTAALWLSALLGRA